VVSLWGRLVPARLGARAQHARIEAIWLSRRVPAATAAAVAARYPAAALFRRRDAMLAEFPVSDLPSYRLGLWRRQYAVSVHVLTTAAAGVALVLVGRRAIEPGGALHATTLEHALVWPHLQALLVALIMVVLGYGLLARRCWVPRLHRPVFGDRVLDTANTVAAGGLLIVVGALLPPGAAAAGFLLSWLAFVTVMVLTLA
jgi:hypothetical protein